MWTIPDIVELGKPAVPSPIIENEMEKKKAFGAALAQGKNAFDAALSVCGDNTNIALFISQKWINDPIVIEAKQIAVDIPEELLDADELAANLLKMSKEKDRTGNFYILEGKDRLAALALYAKIRGYTDKAAPVNNNFMFNSMKVKFVAPEKKELPVNEINAEQLKSPGGLKLKLVSSA